MPNMKKDVLCGELNSRYVLIFEMHTIDKLTQSPINNHEKNTFEEVVIIRP